LTRARTVPQTGEFWGSTQYSPPNENQNFSLEEKHTKATAGAVGDCAQTIDRKEKNIDPRIEQLFSCMSAVVRTINTRRERR
jgi:hypothetical protein